MFYVGYEETDARLLDPVLFELFVELMLKLSKSLLIIIIIIWFIIDDDDDDLLLPSDEEEDDSLIMSGDNDDDEDSEEDSELFQGFARLEDEFEDDDGKLSLLSLARMIFRILFLIKYP